MDLYDAMSTLRAVRRIKPDPIPDEVLDRVLRAATWAPSGGNRQCWRMIVVRDPVLKRELEKLYKPHWNEYTRRAIIYQNGSTKLPSSVFFASILLR